MTKRLASQILGTKKAPTELTIGAYEARLYWHTIKFTCLSEGVAIITAKCS